MKRRVHLHLDSGQVELHCQLWAASSFTCLICITKTGRKGQKDLTTRDGRGLRGALHYEHVQSIANNNGSFLGSVRQ